MKLVIYFAPLSPAAATGPRFSRPVSDTFVSQSQFHCPTRTIQLFHPAPICSMCVEAAKQCGTPLTSSHSGTKGLPICGRGVV